MSAFFALLLARTREYYRDRSALGWSLAFPVFIVIGFLFAFSDKTDELFTVGVIGAPTSELLELEYLDLRQSENQQAAVEQVRYHRLDLLLAEGPPNRYWINPNSPRGYFLEQLLLAQPGEWRRMEVSVQPIRYIDWVMPGILGMNMMFSALFGVGYALVRYRRNGVLKRLQATPVSALQFILAQVASRLLILLAVSSLLFVGAYWAVDFLQRGSILLLLLIALLGGISLIALALVMAARTSSEELAGGLLNLASWPMMFLSRVWFSLDQAHPWMQALAELLPLTHMIRAARQVMLEGAGLLQIQSELLSMAAMSLIFCLIAAALFRWNPAP